MKLFTTLLSALALATYSTTASPVVGADLAAVKRSELIVYSPTVIQPKQGAKWKIGSHQLVLWDTSNVPPGAEKNTGEILLGYDDGTGSENLDFGKSFLPSHFGRTFPAPPPNPSGTSFRSRAHIWGHCVPAFLRRSPPCQWFSDHEWKPLCQSTERDSKVHVFHRS
jgi:hypothetical protein